jgi:proteasome assembly chaperone (PAC2) family protein
LEDTYIKLLYHPELKNPVAVAGLPGLGDVGKLTISILIKSENAKHFADLYSPYFPDFVFVDEGVCRLPRYEFWESVSSTPNLVALTGDFQPSLDDPLAHYILCDKIISFFKDMGCKTIVTIGGYRVSPYASRGVKIVSNSKKLSEALLKEGAEAYQGRIVGAAGLFLGMSRLRGMRGICILAPTHGMFADETAASIAFNFLKRVLFHAKI